MWCSGSYEHICLRGRGFESHWGHIIFVFFLNLILARRGMYMRMGMDFVGRGNEKGNREWEEGIRKVEQGMGDRTRNGSLPFTGLINSRDIE